MAAYRLTQGNFQARFDSLGCLTHLGPPEKIKESPSVFIASGPFREGQWRVNLGNEDIFFDPENSERTYDFDHARLTLKSQYRGPCAWYGLNLNRVYSLEHGLLRCDFSIENWFSGQIQSVAPLRRLRYCSGVNSWTDYSSDWAHRPYPTNLRCEQEFFWGAAISPAHDVVGFFSTGKVDGWQPIYENHGSQRIQTFAIDFVNSLDLHPTRWQHQNIRLDRQTPSYGGTFYAGIFDSLESFFQKAADVLGVAFLAPKSCAGFIGETLSLPVIAPRTGQTSVSIRDEVTGQPRPALNAQNGVLKFPLIGSAGRDILTLSAGGKTTEARIWRQDGWETPLRVAGRHAVGVKRATGYNAEHILGLITVAQAAGLLNDSPCRAAIPEIIAECYDRGYFERETGRNNMHNRLQNYGSFLDAIRASHDYLGTAEWLDQAQKSARQLMSLQHSDGNFYNHHVIYNNVIHPVISLFDWGEHLRQHGRTTEADEIREAVGKAYRNIAREGDDTQTEGSDHFEDGMTSCSGYQIAALWPHYGRKPEDLAMAEGIYLRRRALKARVPDSRYFGATLRHWEIYWAMGLGQCMLGGHGWNAWSASFAHALFMATGKWDYLLDTYSTLTNNLQSVDVSTGQFHVGFAVDPHWRDFYGLGSQHPGEEYIPIPDEVRYACEAHSAFYTLGHSFFHQTYVRIGKDSCEVLNGSVRSHSSESLDLNSRALALREVVISRENKTLAIPRITIDGKPAPKVVLAGEF